MWKKASSYALFCAAALVATASAQNAAVSGTGTTTGDVLVTLPIQVDGSVKDLQLMRGETIEDAAVSFARNHGLLANSDAARVRAVVDQLSGMLRGRIAEMQATDVPVETQPEEHKPTIQLSFPLTINGATWELRKFEDESVEAAVERFLYDGDLTTGAMRELYPQVMDIVLAKLEQLKPPRKELFSFTLTIDGREATTRHFENGDPMEEARETFRGVGITDDAYIEGLAPQIANEIIRRAAAMKPAEQPPTPPVQPIAPTKEVFSIPLTVNERPTILVHYEGYTSRESGVRYLTEHGLANEETMERMLAQVVPIIDNRIDELAQEQAVQEAATRTAAEAAARETTPRQPAVSLSINVGENQVAVLEYFVGDSIERTVELFLTRIGVPEGPSFTQNAAQLAEAVRLQLNTVKNEEEATSASAQEPPPPPPEKPARSSAEPYVQLPVTLAGRVFDLLYFEGEQPGSTANTFCVEKYEVIRAELGMQFDGEQLLECRTLLEQTLHNLIAQKQQQNQPSAAEPVATEQPPSQQVPQAAQPRSRGEHLVTLDIEIGGRNVPFDVHQNDDPEEIARAFCDLHKIGYENVQPLVEAVKDQIARLQ